MTIEWRFATGSYVEYQGNRVVLQGIELVVIGKYLREDGIQVELPFAKHLVQDANHAVSGGLRGELFAKNAVSYARQHESCACDVNELEWHPQSGASLRQPIAERAMGLRAVDGRRARRVYDGAPVP